MPDDALLTSLLAAVDASPDDVPLRLHVAGLLAERDRLPEALAQVTHALGRAPGDPGAVAMLQRLTAAIARPVEPPPAPPAAPSTDGFDWQQAESQVGDVPIPEFAHEPHPDPVTEDVERPTLRLADVGGMEHVKQRLELALLGPLRHPEMAKAFGTSSSGGLLLYGPPGCGKTFIAKAVAGEMGAAFYEVGISDVLDMYTGSSERNLSAVFDAARRNAPCVLFFDEVDALGQKRSHLTHSSSMRNTVNTLLAELDADRNEGVFVLGATNHPWDVDSALRRPGRFDRMLLVLPPDAPARAAVLRHHLQGRPVDGVDLERIVRATEHFSGADLAHLCATATERALADSVRTGTLRPISRADFDAALREVRPSTGPWFATARNVVAFANTDGSYDDLAAHLKQNRKL